MQDKDQEQFTKQLLYYLASFAGGIPVSTLLHSPLLGTAHLVLMYFLLGNTNTLMELGEHFRPWMLELTTPSISKF